MKLFSKTIGAVLAAALLFAGCAAGCAAPGASSGAGMGAGAGADAGTGTNAGEGGLRSSAAGPWQSAAGALRLVTSDENFFAQSPGTENGWYYVDRGASYNANLRYIDYATAQDIYLSSRPEADHHTAEDDSYIPSVLGMGEVFCVGDSLFLLRTGAMGASDTFGADALPAIWRMELSGANRTEIYLGGAAEMLTTTVAADERSLYVVAERMEMEDEAPKQHCILLQIDQQTGSAQDLRLLPDNAELVGAWGSMLVFRTFVDEAPTDGNGLTYGPPEFRVTYYTYALAAGEWRELCQRPMGERCCEHVWNDVLVLGNNSTRTVTLLRLSDGSVSAEYPFPDAVTAEASDAYFLFHSCRDGRFLFWDYFAGAIHSVDLATGEWNAVTTLTYIDPDKQDPRPVQICAESAEEFLVCRDQVIVTRRYTYADDGTAYELEASQPEYALIRKADYWNGVPEYRPVTFVD
ncbi:MAG: hypothetical protein HDT27_03795 [Subdoligranulum sp.]|nr:hypothetical protein [Subdoligranulum sp.]